jgi:hypothetical protein
VTGARLKSARRAKRIEMAKETSLLDESLSQGLDKHLLEEIIKNY